jgi:hypothetical protein
MIWHLDVRDKNVGGGVLPARLVYPPGSDPNATLDLLAVQSEIVFLIHGFNVDRIGGQKQLNDFALGLTPLALGLRPSAFVCITWPGDGKIGPAIYPLVGNDADDAGLELAHFIEWAIPGGAKLSFVTHSMGARVAFECIKSLPSGYSIGQVCVMAAAVDDFGVSEPSVYRAETESAARVAVLASKRDNTLRWAYPLGDFIQSFLFFWKDVNGSALGYHGPRPTHDKPVPGNVEHVQIPTSAGVDHSDYLFIGAPSQNEQRALAWAKQALLGEGPLKF